MSESRYVDLENMDPIVVDQTMHSDFPDVCVRMPIFKHIEFQDHYIELRYRKQQGDIALYVTLSDPLLKHLADGKKSQSKLPLMLPSEEPFGFGQLGPIGNLHMVVTKLKEYHDSGKWRAFFDKPAGSA